MCMLELGIIPCVGTCRVIGLCWSVMLASIYRAGRADFG